MVARLHGTVEQQCLAQVDRARRAAAAGLHRTATTERASSTRMDDQEVEVHPFPGPFPPPRPGPLASALDSPFSCLHCAALTVLRHTGALSTSPTSVSPDVAREARSAVFLGFLTPSASWLTRTPLCWQRKHFKWQPSTHKHG